MGLKSQTAEKVISIHTVSQAIKPDQNIWFILDLYMKHLDPCSGIWDFRFDSLISFISWGTYITNRISQNNHL
jgi:hypothetical protein